MLPDPQKSQAIKAGSVVRPAKTENCGCTVEHPSPYASRDLARASDARDLTDHEAGTKELVPSEGLKNMLAANLQEVPECLYC